MDHTDALFWAGLTLLELYQFTEAITAFEGVEDNHPDDDQAWYYHGKALVALHELQKAEFILKHSLQLNDQSADAWYLLADVQHTRKAYADALQSVGKALDLSSVKK